MQHLTFDCSVHVWVPVCDARPDETWQIFLLVIVGTQSGLVNGKCSYSTSFGTGTSFSEIITEWGHYWVRSLSKVITVWGHHCVRSSLIEGITELAHHWVRSSLGDVTTEWRHHWVRSPLSEVTTVWGHYCVRPLLCEVTTEWGHHRVRSLLLSDVECKSRRMCTSGRWLFMPCEVPLLSCPINHCVMV